MKREPRELLGSECERIDDRLGLEMLQRRNWQGLPMQWESESQGKTGAGKAGTGAR